MASPRKPAIELTGYQSRWVLDKSRFKIGVITRQGGKSFSNSLEAVDDCMEKVLTRKRTKWVFLSAGERQSKELMGAAAMHAKAYNLGMSELESEFRDEASDTKYKQLEIVFPHGSRIIGLPANPATARGHSAHILLDEFAFHKDSRGIWKALFPTITRGYKIRIISTFQGKANKFYELIFSSPTLQIFNGLEHVFKGDRGGWSKHFVNIHQAVEMGLVLKDDEGNPCEPEDLRLALNDDDAWAEEFECIPSDEAHAFLSHDLISSVEDQRLVKMPSWAEWLVERARANYSLFLQTKIEPELPRDVLLGVDFLGELYVGFDVARKKDLSIIWVDQKIGSVLQAIAVIDLKSMPYMVQEQVLWTIMSHPRFRRGCIDETGLGNQLAERSKDRFGEHRVEPVTFSQANKEALAVELKRNFEDRRSLIPCDSTIRASLHSVKRYAAAGGHFRFDADRTDQIGHADHFWAKGLSVLAATGPAPSKYDGETTEEECDYVQAENF